MSVQVKVVPLAEDANGRRSERYRLRLALTTPEAGNATLHDISRSGLLLQSSADLNVGELINVDLPEAAENGAEIIWKSGDLFGCEFRQPISKAAVSAALLMSVPLSPSAASFPPVPVRRLSPRYRLLLIVGLSSAAWVAIKVAAAAVF